MKKSQWELYFDALKAQDWAGAVRILEELAKADPQNPQVHLKLGDTYQRAGDSNKAVPAYHRAARMLADEGFFQKALALYKIILRLAPYDMEAMDRSREIIAAAEGASGTRTIVPAAVKTEEPAEQDVIKGVRSEPSPEGMFGEIKLPPPAEPEPAPEAEAGFGQAPGPGFASEPPDEIEIPRPLELPAEWLQSSSYAGEQAAAGAVASGLSDLAAAAVPSLFAGLPMDEVARVTDGLITRTYGDGEKVVEEGDMGDSLYIIRSGRAIVHANIMGREIELASLGPGDVFGEVSFLTGRPRTADVIARGQLEAYEVTRQTIEDVIGKNPSVLARLQEFFEARVRDTIRKVK